MDTQLQSLYCNELVEKALGKLNEAENDLRRIALFTSDAKLNGLLVEADAFINGATSTLERALTIQNT
jgi:hypothetical protein